MTTELNIDAQARLDAHLDAVENALLVAGCSRERRRGIVDDLETQIHDMLASKSDAPTMADLEDVLATLDPPAAYGAVVTPPGAAPAASAPPPGPAAPPLTPLQRTPSAPPSQRYSRTAIWGLVCILLSLLPVPLFLVGAFFWLSMVHVPRPATGVSVSDSPEPIRENRVSRPALIPASPTRPSPFPVSTAARPTGPERDLQVMHAPSLPSRSVASLGFVSYGALLGIVLLVLMVPLAVAGTVLGWVAFGQIRGSGGSLRGTGMALFDGLFYPVLLVIASAITPFFLPIVGLALLAMSIAVVWIVIRLATGKRVLG